MVLHSNSKLILKRWRNKSAAQLLAAEWFRDTVVCRGMVPRHRHQSRNSSATTKFFKSPRRTLSEYPCGGLARTLFSAFRRRKFRQSAADPIGSAAEQICSAAVRQVRGGIFCSAAKLNLADSAGVRRGPARTQADPGGVRGGIVPPWELPIRWSHDPRHIVQSTPKRPLTFIYKSLRQARGETRNVACANGSLYRLEFTPQVSIVRNC